jgi:hypothetical protein
LIRFVWLLALEKVICQAFMLTSNGVEITKDLANRSLVTRIKKHPEGHKFKIDNEGDLLDHVVANQPHYLGAVFAIVGEWIKQGMQRTPGIHHDFRKSVGAADWICRELLGRADLLDGHRDIQNRVSNPIEGKLRELALWLESNDKPDEPFAAIELIDLCESAPQARLRFPVESGTRSRGAGSVC